MGPVSAEPGPNEADFRRSSILVATSDSATRSLLRQILHVRAVDITDVVDGVEALALTRRLDLDLIVLDAFLAVMDGISVCGRIRALPDIDQPPILMVGLISERAVEIALSVGADETLSKPLNPRLIRSRTRALLTRRHREKRQRLMERAVQDAPVGMTLLDGRSSEYSVVQANPAFSETTGYSADEILGRNLRLLTGPDTDVTAMTELRHALAEGRPSRVLLKNYRKDGRPFWNDLATAPVFDEAGRLTHFVTVQNDVTALVDAPARQAARAIEEAVLERTRDLDSALSQVEKQRRFVETILNSMVSAILATDAKGTVTFANLGALRTLGTSLSDCVGRSVVELFGHNEGVAEVVGGAPTTHPEHRLDFPMTTPGGARIYVGISIMHAPPESHEEVSLIFQFRNLAETVLDEDDPRLTGLGEDEVGPGRNAPPVGTDGEPEEGSAAAGAEPGGDESPRERDESGSGDLRAARRRVLLSLRYTQPPELVRAVIEQLAAERAQDGPFVRLEAEDDVPEVLIDRKQASEALSALLATTLDRCGDPSGVHVRVSRTEAEGVRGGRPGPAARIEILYATPPVGDPGSSSGADEQGRRTFRRTDLAAAEKLIEANGGRLLPPRPDGKEQVLTVLLRASG
jgi:PAS domain S-box-containing protein